MWVNHSFWWEIAYKMEKNGNVKNFSALRNIHNYNVGNTLELMKIVCSSSRARLHLTSIFFSCVWSYDIFRIYFISTLSSGTTNANKQVEWQRRFWWNEQTKNWFDKSSCTWSRNLTLTQHPPIKCVQFAIYYVCIIIREAAFLSCFIEMPSIFDLDLWSVRPLSAFLFNFNFINFIIETC